MMLSVTAYAKINWSLDVVGVRADGYHELDMLMQSVSLADHLVFREADRLSLTVDRAEIPADGRNLVLRAATALRNATGCRKGAAIELHKEIPSEAGMGGGSADAAAALRALNLLWSLGCSEETLQNIGLAVGADVPFCVQGGLQRVRGIGERLTPLSLQEALHLLVVLPCRGLSTGEVFSGFHGTDGGRIDIGAAERALLSGDTQALGRLLGNALEPAAIRRRPEIRTAIETLRDAGACAARMTGSGAAVFGVFQDEASCLKALETVRPFYPFAEAVHTVEAGSEIIFST